MDTIKILLTLTVALLVGALAMSWKNFRGDVKGTDPKALAEVNRQIAEIEAQRDKLRQERERWLRGEPLSPPSSPTPAPAAPEVREMSADEVPATGAVFGDDIPEPTNRIETTPDPAPAGLEERAQAIAAAAVVATIQEWVDDPEIGTIAVLAVKDAAAVKADSILCIRRNSGILGRVKVSEVTPEGAIASGLGNFGEVKPKVGDELIVEP